MIQVICLESVRSANISQGRAALVIGEDQAAAFQLEVNQLPLGQVLKDVAKQTGIPIHFSVLPEGLVTATCVGGNLKPVLECLLNKKADLIVRYPRESSKIAMNGEIVEAWVLGSRLDAVQNDCRAGNTNSIGTMTLRQRNEQAEANQQKDLLIKAAQSNEAPKRAEAVGALLGLQIKGDPEIKEVLEKALLDPAAEVRAQAISTYARLENEDATTAIQQAMQDTSVDVRMMAVDAITDNDALLQQATQDSDVTIRDYAKLKLDELSSKRTK